MTKQHQIYCPLCGAPMRLIQTKNTFYSTGERKLFYGCSNFPVCKKTIGSAPDGTPNQHKVADPETREWRNRAHYSFDKLWKGPKTRMTREEAYSWLANTMFYKDSKKAHIGTFTKEQCEQLINILQTKFKIKPKRGK